MLKYWIKLMSSLRFWIQAVQLKRECLRCQLVTKKQVAALNRLGISLIEQGPVFASVKLKREKKPIYLVTTLDSNIYKHKDKIGKLFKISIIDVDEMKKKMNKPLEYAG